ncbi:MAG: terminase gpA endonuclease subunit [Pseudomonadota bacterium]
MAQRNSAVAEISWLPGELEAMRPAERTHPADWIECRWPLPSDSAIKGYCDLSMIPQFRPVIEDFMNPDVDEIYLCCSSQSAKTTVCLALSAYVAHQKKWPVIFVLADQLTAEDEMSTKRVKPAFENDEYLCRAIDYSRWTKNTRGFLGGHGIIFSWASSVAQTASRSAGLVIADEINKPGYDPSPEEGDKILYIIQRLETYWGATFIGSSTPTTVTGRITAIGNRSDVLPFDNHVPCHKCGQKQPLRFSREHAYGFDECKYRGEDGRLHNLGQVVWEGGRKASMAQIYETARYECGECGEKWTTAQKNQALQDMIAVPRREPAGERKHWYHNGRLTTLFQGGRIEKLVADFVGIVNQEGEDRKRQLATWFQNAHAEPSTQKTMERKESSILALRDDRPRGLVPSEGVLGLTCGADTQDNGFYYYVHAWGRPVGGKLETWLVRDGFVETLEALEQIITGKFQDAQNVDYVVSMTLIDAMGHRTSEVYDWCRTKADIKPAQGVQRMATPYQISMLEFYPNSTRQIPGGLRLYRLNSNYYKDALYAKIGVAPGDPGAFHAHSEIGEDYAKQMTAEFINDQGFWDCPGNRPNHAWDGSYLALAAADILGIQHWGGTKPASQQQQPRHGHPQAQQNYPTPQGSAQDRIHEALRGRTINPYGRR